MIAYLCLGANLGKPVSQIQRAVIALAAHPRIKVLRASSQIQTKPYGKTDQPDFWNQVLEIDTELTPQELLLAVQAVETGLGRIRNEKWGPRVIDIDILLFEDTILNSDTLTLPHPDFHNRLFALRLMAELAPHQLHPVLNQDFATLYHELEHLEDKQ